MAGGGTEEMIAAPVNDKANTYPDARPLFLTADLVENVTVDGRPFVK